MMTRLAALAKALLNLIYPLHCHACGSKMLENNGLCESCVSRIHKNEYGIAAASYEGVLKDAIHLFKYKGVLSLKNTLSKLLLDFAGRSVDMKKIDAIVPIPLHSAKMRERGFNQALLLSSPMAKRYKLPVSAANFIKRKSTKPQSELNRRERFKNIRGAFFVKRPSMLKGKNVLLVDDVFTTGATITEASRVLKKAGAADITVLTLARGI